MFRREMGSKRGSLPPKEGDLTCMTLTYLLTIVPKSVVPTNHVHLPMEAWLCNVFILSVSLFRGHVYRNFRVPRYDVNTQPYTRGTWMLVGRTSRYRRRVICQFSSNFEYNLSFFLYLSKYFHSGYMVL